MDTDLIFVVGLVLAPFPIPSIVSAWSERRVPRTAAIVVVVGCAMIVWALTQKPGGYRLEQVPDVIVGVIGRLIN